MKLVAEYMVAYNPSVTMNEHRSKLKNRIKVMTKSIIRLKAEGHTIKNIKPSDGWQACADVYFHVRIFE